jgi:hypothetical protein
VARVPVILVRNPGIVSDKEKGEKAYVICHQKKD